MTLNRMCHRGTWVIFALAAFHSGLLLAQTANLSLSSATSTPGGTVVLNLSLSTSGTLPAGLEWTLTYPAGQIPAIAAFAGPAATAANKTLSCASASGSLTCLLIGSPTTGATSTIASGVVATVQVTLAPNAGTTAIALTNPFAVSPAGRAWPSWGRALSSPSPTFRLSSAILQPCIPAPLRVAR